MDILKRRVPIVIFIIMLIGIIFAYSRFQYNDVYSLSLNGRVENIRTDIKEALYVTISNKEHVFGKYYWPEFHQHVEIGDSVYKEAKEYDIILIKPKTKERIICTYRK